MSKYLLVEHNDSGDPIVTIFDNTADRAKATREAILGPDDKESDCPDLLTLAEEGSVRYEGDPGLDWIDALDVRDKSDGLRSKLTAAEAELSALREASREVLEAVEDWINEDLIVGAEPLTLKLRQAIDQARSK